MVGAFVEFVREISEKMGVRDTRSRGSGGVETTSWAREERRTRWRKRNMIVMLEKRIDQMQRKGEDVGKCTRFCVNGWRALQRIYLP